MRQLERLGLPAWCLAVVLVFFPLLDVLQTVWPLQPGEIAWRFGAAGLISRIALTPLLGLALAYFAALLLGQARMLRVLSFVNAILVVVLIAGVAVFVLDAIQMRARVPPDATTRFDVGSAAALGKFGLAFIVLVVLLVSEWRASSALGRRRKASRSDASAVLVQRAKRRAPAPETEPSAEPPEAGGGG